MSRKCYPATAGDFFLAGLSSYMSRHGQGLNYGVTVLRLEALPDKDALEKAWKNLYRLHPVLGARLKRQLLKWKLVWQTGAPVAAPPISWHEAGAENPTPALIKSRMSGVIHGEPIPHALTLEVFPPTGSRECIALLVWRHELLDGMGVNLLLEYLAPGIALQHIAAPEPAPAPQAEHQTIGKLFNLARPAIHALQGITRAGSRSAWPREGPLAGASEYRMIELSQVESEVSFNTCRRYCGEIFQMPYYAAIAARALRALHQLRGWPSPVYHLQVPFQASKRPGNAVFQNRMKTLLLALQQPQLATLESAVPHVLSIYKEALRSRLPQAFDSLMTMMEVVPVKGFLPFIRYQNNGEVCSLFHSHTGTFLPGTEKFAGARIANIYSIPGVSNPPGLGVFFSDYRGIITVILSWRNGALNQGEVDAVSQQIVADLTTPALQAEAHGAR